VGIELGRKLLISIWKIWECLVPKYPNLYRNLLR